MRGEISRVQAPRLGPLLFHAEGRECVHRRGDLARPARARSPSGPRTAPRSSRPASSPPTRAGRNIRSSSSGWSWRARARCWLCSNGAARRSPPKGCSMPARKRKLPFLPRVIGVVTSPTGAVIRDILHRLEDRCPTHVIVWPVPVQGEGAAAKIAAAIRGFPVARAAARPADRRARRRVDRGSVGVQRGRGRARRRRIADPADLRGRATRPTRR